VRLVVLDVVPAMPSKYPRPDPKGGGGLGHAKLAHKFFYWAWAQFRGMCTPPASGMIVRKGASMAPIWRPGSACGRVWQHNLHP
jgi:hypothetical protein